MALGPTQPPF